MPRAGLDSARVVRAAASIADRDGLAAVSLTRLAKELGVKPPSLYNHIDNLPALLDQLAILAVSDLLDLSAGAIMGRHGVDALRALADSQRAYAKAHPGLFEATLRSLHGRGGAAEDIANRYLAVFLAILRGFAIDGEAALHMIRCMRAAVSGFITLEIRGGFAMGFDCDESFRLLIEILATGIAAQASI